MAQAIFHNAVKRALQKDGWRITHDPLIVSDGDTELGVDTLLEQGVPQDQIVLGFHAPQHRQYTGFATGSEVAA